MAGGGNLNWIIALIPLGVSYYTYTYGVWVWRKGNRAGGAGIFILAAVTLLISFYSIFFRRGY